MSGNDTLAQGLLQAVLAQDFGAETPPFPSIDLALAAFEPGGTARFANVLLSREHRGGVVAAIDDRAGAVGNIRFDCDQRDAAGVSVAWLPRRRLVPAALDDAVGWFPAAPGGTLRRPLPGFAAEADGGSGRRPRHRPGADPRLA